MQTGWFKPTRKFPSLCRIQGMRLKWFITPSGKIVEVLDHHPDVPTAQGQGTALVKGDFDSKPWLIETCLLSPPGGYDTYPYELDHRFRKVAQPAS